MDHRNPQDPFYRAMAAVAAAVALGFAFTSHDVTATNAVGQVTPELAEPADYFPGRFSIKPAAGDSDEHIPTF